MPTDGERDGLLPTPVWAIGAGVAALLVLVAPRYGWHRDELYFRTAGQHLEWGYVDQPPFTPFIARLAETVAPGNLVVLRLLPALTAGVVVVMGAAIARELGGQRWAQCMAAGVTAAGGFLLGVGHLLSTATFDLAMWTGLLLLACRLLRTGDPRWWMAFGAVAGLALLNKHLVVLLVVALLLGLAADRRWILLWTPWLVGGGALAVALAAPNLAWQLDHGWPQLDMAEVLSERLAGENRIALLPLQLLFFGPLLVPLLWWGARWLAAAPEGRSYRPLLWAWPAGLAITFAAGGRPYYALPLTLVVGLAGTVAAEGRAPAPPRLTVPIIGSGALAALIALPLLPVATADVTGELNDAVVETVGWPELAEQVAGVVETLPPEERTDVVLLTGSYGEAGALDRFGPAWGLPPAHSPHNGYADFRRPHLDGATVVAVRLPVAVLREHFDHCAQVARIDNGLGIDNEAQGQPILVCRGLLATWEEVWEDLRFLA